MTLSNMTEYKLTAADFADTGQWRMIVRIKPTGLEAALQHTLHKEIPLQPLCKMEWEADEANFLKRLEDAVYQNPRLLDDFATKIVVYDLKTIFIPAEKAEDYPDGEAGIYREVFDVALQDVMWEQRGDLVAAWSLAPGVRRFLLRSFPGARITCNLMEKVENELNYEGGLRLRIDLREGEADFIATENGKLLTASTHTYKDSTSLKELTSDLMEAYEFNGKPRELVVLPDGGLPSPFDKILMNLETWLSSLR